MDEDKRYNEAFALLVTGAHQCRAFPSFSLLASRRIQAIEPFDEHEEWQEKCNHYMIAIGGKGCLKSLPEVRQERIL